MLDSQKNSETAVLVASDDEEIEPHRLRHDPVKRNRKRKQIAAAVIFSLTACSVVLALVLLISARGGRWQAWFTTTATVTTTTGFDEGWLIAGVYRLESVGSNFDEYLASLDIPEHVMKLIRDTSETVEIRGPRGDEDDDEDDLEDSNSSRNGTWSMTMTTDYGQHTLAFHLGESFSVHHSEDGSSLSHLCTRPSPNVLDCVTVAPARGWRIRAEMTFGEDGYVEVIRNVNRGGIATRKVYKRVTTQDDEEAMTTTTTEEESYEEIDDDDDHDLEEAVVWE